MQLQWLYSYTSCNGLEKALFLNGVPFGDQSTSATRQNSKNFNLVKVSSPRANI